MNVLCFPIYSQFYHVSTKKGINLCLDGMARYNVGLKHSMYQHDRVKLKIFDCHIFKVDYTMHAPKRLHL